jgi:hypothetical protein
MSDVNVVVENAPIEITSCLQNVIDISVAENGTQGPPGPSGSNGINGAGSTAGVTGISVTGFQGQTGLINISGLGTITVHTGQNNSIFISGSSVGAVTDHNDAINLSGNLTTTGQILYSYITNVSGNLTTNINLITSRTGDFVLTGNLIKYSVFATSGIETELINYPFSFNSRPITINCEFENDRDNLMYAHTLSGITNSNFWINYSDFLSNSGYKINISINR